MSKTILSWSEKIKKFRFSIIAVILVIAICTTSLIAVASTAYTVNITVDGKKTTVSTVRTTANGVLSQAGIDVDSNDLIDTTKYKAFTASSITVTTRCAVSVVDGSKEAVKVVAHGSVADALNKANVKVDSADKLNHKLSTKLTEDMVIKIVRAFTVSIVSEDKVMPIKITNGTVADALSKAGIAITSKEKLNCSTTDKLTPFMVIEIIPIKTVTRTEKKSIAYSTVTQKTNELVKGETVVSQKGQVGQRTLTYQDTYEGRKLVSSKLVSNKITKQAVDKIVLEGTNTAYKLAKNVPAASELAVPSDLKLDKNNVPLNYRYKATGSATAYYAPVGSLTASGRHVIPGHVAVNPNQFPYGTKLWIVGTNGYVYGYSVAADTGGFVYFNNNTIVDLFYWTYAECCNWGRHDVTVYAL